MLKKIGNNVLSMLNCNIDLSNKINGPMYTPFCYIENRESLSGEVPDCDIVLCSNSNHIHAFTFRLIPFEKYEPIYLFSYCLNFVTTLIQPEWS